ncbi:hypothetical protein N431DRAFT_209846 [Stipitochalara longipes BDJ]|nr:hypothetical protein N431DRAFT_209846 [Stipitochalara longipes BDJ]
MGWERWLKTDAVGLNTLCLGQAELRILEEIEDILGKDNSLVRMLEDTILLPNVSHVLYTGPVIRQNHRPCTWWGFEARDNIFSSSTRPIVISISDALEHTAFLLPKNVMFSVKVMPSYWQLQAIAKAQLPLTIFCIQLHLGNHSSNQCIPTSWYFCKSAGFCYCFPKSDNLGTLRGSLQV